MILSWKLNAGPRRSNAAVMRLPVLKTYKLHVGGKFPRGESGRVVAAKSPAGEHLANYCVASRKDFRDAVVAARKAQELGFDTLSCSSTGNLAGAVAARAACRAVHRLFPPPEPHPLAACRRHTLRMAHRNFKRCLRSDLKRPTRTDGSNAA